MASECRVRVVLKTSILLSSRTQRAFSIRIGIPEGRLSSLVRGRTDPTEQESRVLCHALGCPARVLFHRGPV
jgi:hypothetical protein